MSFLCRIGLHKWKKKEARLRRGTWIRYCERCRWAKVRHNKPVR